MRHATLTLAVLCLFASPAFADELFVPSAEYPTIQAAVDAAVDGDEVVLLDGVFTGPGNLDVVMPPRVITIRAQHPRAAIVEGEASGIGSGPRAMSFSIPASSGTTIEGIIFRKCNGGTAGGAIRVEDCSPVFMNCAFLENETNSGSGGAVAFFRSDAEFLLCDFSENGAYSEVGSGFSSGLGGAVMVSEGSPLFDRCTFHRNGAAGNGMFGTAEGGAIAASDSTMAFLRCSFTNNSATGASAVGGAVRTENCDMLALDCKYTQNSALGEGRASCGAICHIEGTLTMINGQIVSNRADDDFENGAGVGGLYSEGHTHITNLTIADNAAIAGPCGFDSSFGGVALFGTAVVSNCTIVGNTACLEPNFAFGGTVLEVNNSIFRHRTESLSIRSGSDATISYSNIEGGFPGEGNIDADPLFEAGTYHLLPGSPCIDAGNTDLLPADEFDLDGDGDTTEPLPLDAAGLARFVDDPATPDTGMGFPVVDMGAFEYQPPCRVDLDGDGVLTIFDFLAFFNAFDDADPVADFDGDGAFTVFDFLAFQDEFDAGCA